MLVIVFLPHMFSKTQLLPAWDSEARVCTAEGECHYLTITLETKITGNRKTIADSFLAQPLEPLAEGRRKSGVQPG